MKVNTIVFWNPLLLRAVIGLSKGSRCQDPSKILAERQEKQKVSQAKQEQSENRPHRTPKSAEPQYEYKMRTHSHEGIEMQMHHIADRKFELVIPRVF